MSLVREGWKPLKTTSSDLSNHHCTDGFAVKLTSKPRNGAGRKKQQKTSREHAYSPPYQWSIIGGIWEKKSSCQLLEVRFGLISYRDHPPQERTYVTQSHPFTEDVETMRGPLIHPMGYGQRWTRGQEPSCIWEKKLRSVSVWCYSIE